MKMIAAALQTNDDAELLDHYAQDRSEAAFTELVRRHVNLVYSAALRQVGGDAATAQDVTQGVFTELARQANRLARHPALAGWLYTTTRRVAAHALRANRRRLQREQEAQMIQEIGQEPADAELDWDRVQPVLDAAMHDLNEADRLAILLRHFERRPLAEVGVKLGLSENAARMRVERALEKLRGLLAKRGVTSTASALVLALGSQSVVAAPATLAATITSAAMTATTTASIGLLSMITTINLKAVSTALVLVSAGAGLYIQHQSAQKLDAENHELRQQLADVLGDAESARRTAVQNAEALERARQPEAELLRLRGEVARLRQELASVSRTAASAAPLSPSQEASPEADEEAYRAMGIRRLNEAKLLMLGFFMFAGDNGDQFPESLEVALGRVKSEVTDPEQLEVVQTLQTSDYEIIYQGSSSEITNPAQTIVVRQREAWRGPNGWMRTYGFADGHSELHRSDSGDYTEWESRQQVQRRSQATPDASAATAP